MNALVQCVKCQPCDVAMSSYCTKLHYFTVLTAPKAPRCAVKTVDTNLSTERHGFMNWGQHMGTVCQMSQHFFKSCDSTPSADPH
jgi:hypothetical protein